MSGGGCSRSSARSTISSCSSARCRLRHYRQRRVDLGSLGKISDDAKYWLVASAAAGGGLTVIANASNPAGASLLEKGFAEETISTGGLLAGALLPTAIAAAAFALL